MKTIIITSIFLIGTNLTYGQHFPTESSHNYKKTIFQQQTFKEKEKNVQLEVFPYNDKKFGINLPSNYKRQTIETKQQGGIILGVSQYKASLKTQGIAHSENYKAKNYLLRVAPPTTIAINNLTE